ncbi:MAG: T9SS type A sorting domain-containing protein [Lewinellaceae bacterium]|nr:T9SS type A sorting domain-containing protein [Lewinellaceae bacterium]
MKSAPAVAFQFVCLLLSGLLHAQDGKLPSPHDLFSNTQTTVTEAGPDEKRARTTTLQPFPGSTKIDLSGLLRFRLFDDVQYTLRLERQEGPFFSGLEVWTGRAGDTRFDHLNRYKNTVVVVNPETNKLVATIQTEKGYFQILPTATVGEYRIRECKNEPFDCQLLRAKEAATQHSPVHERTVCGSSCLEETDPGGQYVIDIFIGYSNSAATVAGDINAHALSMVQSVNNGLTNSLVTSTYLRLVGTGTTPNNPGVITSVLDDCYDWFAGEIETYAPDLVAVFQTPTGAAGEAGGWGYIGGYSSVNSINLPTAFRHEIGHNAGGGHCPGGNGVFPYAHGYDNGNWTTHMCGNGVNFYSNPDVNDNQGNPIGDAATADMARTWDERAAIMAQHRLHREPFFGGDPCVNQICIPSHWGGQNELIRRVVFHTIDNNQSNPGWNCPSITGYSDYTNLSTTINQNSTYTLTVTSTFAFPDSKLGAWIDWNNDGILSSTEQVANFSGVGPWSQNVTVPPDAHLGDVRLRIRLQYGPNYTPDPCDGSGWSSGETEDYIVVPAAPLPISLVDFQGKRTEQGNLLRWQTAEEINASHFDLEHSRFSQQFEKIARLETKGNGSEYVFWDKQNRDGTQYYRLKMVDRDGSFQYSKIIHLAAESSDTGIVLSPNPTNGLLNIRLFQPAEGAYRVLVFNSTGQLVREFAGLVAENADATLVIDLSGLPGGVYGCTLLDISGNAVLGNARVVKW